MPRVRLPIDAPRCDRSATSPASGRTAWISSSRLRRFPAEQLEAAHRTIRVDARRAGRVGHGLLRPARLARPLHRPVRSTTSSGEIGRRSLEDEGVDIGGPTSCPAARTRFAMILVDGRTGDRTVLWDRDARLALTRAPTSPARPSAPARVLLVDCDDVGRVGRGGDASRGRPAWSPRSTSRRSCRASIACCRSSTSSSPRRGFRSGGRPHRRLAARSSGSTPSSARRSRASRSARGSLARCQGHEIRTPAFPVPCVDSTGAGDAFRGGFIARCCSTDPMRSTCLLRIANAVAALKCRTAGAREGLPHPASWPRCSRRTLRQRRRPGLDGGARRSRFHVPSAPVRDPGKPRCALAEPGTRPATGNAMERNRWNEEAGTRNRWVPSAVHGVTRPRSPCRENAI